MITLINRLAIIVILAFSFASCSVVKKIKKSEEKSFDKTFLDVETGTKTDVKTEAKISIVTTELADTTITTPESEILGSKPFENLKDKPLVLEDGWQTINVSFDSATGNVNVKGTKKQHSINIKVQKRTEKNEDIVQVETSDVTATIKAENEKTTESKTTDRDVKRTSLPWWIWLILIIAIVAFAGWKYLKFQLRA